MLWQLIRFEAPMMSFGGVKVDYDGPSEKFPMVSAVTGLIANALGYDRSEADRLQALQDNIILGSRVTRDGEILVDFHTAKLSKDDKGWTQWGVEKRAGGDGTYDAPAVQRKTYIADGGYLLAVGLLPGAGISVPEVGAALDRPQRILFIGRKCCIPSCRLNAGQVEAQSAKEALELTLASGTARACWPIHSGGEENADRIRSLADRRNFHIDRHAGATRIAYGRITAKAAQ